MSFSLASRNAGQAEVSSRAKRCATPSLRQQRGHLPAVRPVALPVHLDEISLLEGDGHEHVRRHQSRELSARYKQAILDIVHEIAERSGASEPKLLAEELCMIIDAAYVGRVVTADSSTIDIARRLAERAIQAHLGS